MNKRIDVFHTICSGYIYKSYIYIYKYIVYNMFYLLVVLTTVYIAMEFDSVLNVTLYHNSL